MASDKMLALKIPLKEAQKVKESKTVSRIISQNHIPKKENGFIFYPLTKKVKSEYEIIEKEFLKKKERVNMKDSLAGKLSIEEMQLLKTSMDVVGTIAILEIPFELEKHESLIAEEVLKSNKNVKTVLKKGKHEGPFRTQKLHLLAGVDTRDATYRENECIIKVDVEQVYFSPRLSNERKRITNLVKKNENVLILGSGAGPYICVIAKHSGAKEVIGIEINPKGNEYANENIKLNKIKNAKSICADAASAKDLKMKFDRIIMPMPANADEFLDVALSVANKGAMIHFYDFELESEVEKGVDKIRKACDKAKRKFKLIEAVKTGMPGPRKYRYSYDFVILN